MFSERYCDRNKNESEFEHYKEYPEVFNQLENMFSNESSRKFLIHTITNFFPLNNCRQVPRLSKEKTTCDITSNLLTDLDEIKTGKNDFEIGEITQTQLSRESKLLDIGSGTGHHVASFSKAGVDATGVDISQDMVNKAKMNYYYDLPQDIITLIEDKVKEEELIKKSLNKWKTKMKLVNYIFIYGCEFEVNTYTDMIEQGMTYREIPFLFNLAEEELNFFR